MSSPDLRNARRFGSLAAAMLLALGVSACFRPLNGPTASGASLQQVMSGIVIDEVPDRLGHYLVEELRFGLDGSGVPGKAMYRLTIQTTEAVQSAIVNSVTGTATSAALIGKAEFTLATIDKDEKVLTGTATASASYSRNEQRFASVRAARDAQIRVANLLAEQIRTRIAARLATKS
jgi:LPS-assembly lipoprotein